MESNVPDATLRLGVYQSAGTAGDVAANMAEMLAVMAQSAADGLDLLAFPEGFLTGYHLPDADIKTLPDTKEGVAAICTAARQTGLAVVFGLAERDGGQIYNTALAISPQGDVLARYRKRALFGEWEQGFFTRGREPAMFQLMGFSIGLLICYDVEFPELARQSARLGAEILLVPTSLMVPFNEVADLLVPTRALENQIFVAYANRTGTENGLSYVGRSSICDPHGRVLAKAGSTGPCTIVATLHKSALAGARTQFSYHRDLERLQLP